MCHLQAGLKPVCDRADYSDGRCAVTGGHWSLTTVHDIKNYGKGLPWKPLRGSFLYSGTLSSHATMDNGESGRTSIAYADGNQRDGDTYCEFPCTCMCACAPLAVLHRVSRDRHEWEPQ